MELTKELKAKIDVLSYKDLLTGIRFQKMGMALFQGASGYYWGARLQELKQSVDHVVISKQVGWDSQIVDRETLQRLGDCG